jgi:hypothetical protein
MASDIQKIKALEWLVACGGKANKLKASPSRMFRAAAESKRFLDNGLRMAFNEAKGGKELISNVTQRPFFAFPPRSNNKKLNSKQIRIRIQFIQFSDPILFELIESCLENWRVFGVVVVEEGRMEIGIKHLL